MNAAATSIRLAPLQRSRAAWVFYDSVAVTWRNLISYVRIPEAFFFSSVQPVMFILLFRYVFGGAIGIAGALPSRFTYVDFLMPGVFTQTVAFGAVGTAIALADDMNKGLIERFRSLPMARSAVLAGRTVADMCRNVFVMLLMTGVGYAVGFRIRGAILAYIAGIGLLLLFAFALSWGFATLGLLAPNSETAQLMSFPILMPLSFASSAFVPVASMPGWLQAFARNQPLSVVVDAMRALTLGLPAGTHVVKSLAWSAGICAVLAPLAVMRYRRAA